MTIYALLTDQGTAAAETALCSVHRTLENEAEARRSAEVDVLPTSKFVDCSKNDALECIACTTREAA